MDFPKLKAYMDSRQLLEEEKKMWIRLGIYITTEPYRKVFGDVVKDCVTLVDGIGNEWPIPSQIGSNIRLSILAWWQVEKVNPRIQEADPTGLGSLENRSV